MAWHWKPAIVLFDKTVELIFLNIKQEVYCKTTEVTFNLSDYKVIIAIGTLWESEN